MNVPLGVIITFHWALVSLSFYTSPAQTYDNRLNGIVSLSFLTCKIGFRDNIVNAYNLVLNTLRKLCSLSGDGSASQPHGHTTCATAQGPELRRACASFNSPLFQSWNSHNSHFLDSDRGYRKKKKNKVRRGIGRCVVKGGSSSHQDRNLTLCILNTTQRCLAKRASGGWKLPRGRGPFFFAHWLQAACCRDENHIGYNVLQASFDAVAQQLIHLWITEPCLQVGTMFLFT